MRREDEILKRLELADTQWSPAEVAMRKHAPADLRYLLDRVAGLEAAILKHQTDFNESDEESDDIHEALWSHVSDSRAEAAPKCVFCKTEEAFTDFNRRPICRTCFVNGEGY